MAGYDSYATLPPWARDTLERHAADPRPSLYDLVGAARRVGSGNYALRVEGRTGPDEIGQLIAFLATSGGAYVTGTTIVVDGGMDAWGLGIAPPSTQGSLLDGGGLAGKPHRAHRIEVVVALARPHRAHVEGDLPARAQTRFLFFPRAPLRSAPGLRASTGT